MPLTTRKSWTALVAVAATAAVALGGAASAAQVAKPKAGPDWPWPGPGAHAKPGTGCANLDLKEVITSSHNWGGSNPNPNIPSVGMQGVYTNKMYDKATGAEIGHVDDGYIHIVYARKADGHLMDWGREDIVLSDGGVIRAQGWFDITAMWSQGAWEPLAAKGISGKYKGWTGIEEFQAVKAPVDFNEKLILCG